MGTTDQQVPGLHLGDISLDLRTSPIGFLSRGEPSLAQHDRHRSIYPTLTYDIPISNFTHEQLQSDLLVGDGDTPSFPSSAGAFNAFFYADFQVTGTNMPSLGKIVLRISDQRARFGRVVVRPSSVDLTIEGFAATGAHLELNSVSARHVIEMTGPGDVSLPLPDGLPADAWVWLKQGTEWLDYRSLSGWPAYKSPGVEVETPDDPVANLSALIAQGEGDQLEFKSKLPESRDEKRHAFKTAVAFAVGNGGTIIFGVDDRTGVVLGLERGATIFHRHALRTYCVTWSSRRRHFTHTSRSSTESYFSSSTSTARTAACTA